MKLTEAKLLTDENISPKLVRFFRDRGFDVLDVKEQQWHGTPDKELLLKASTENRVIVTHDSDFGTLSVNQGVPCFGIIYIRLKQLLSAKIIETCTKLLQNNPDISRGTILVVNEKRIRIRKIHQN